LARFLVVLEFDKYTVALWCRRSLLACLRSSPFV
jgi:hypothetical protein